MVKKLLLIFIIASSMGCASSSKTVSVSEFKRVKCNNVELRKMLKEEKAKTKSEKEKREIIDRILKKLLEGKGLNPDHLYFRSDL